MSFTFAYLPSSNGEAQKKAASEEVALWGACAG